MAKKGNVSHSDKSGRFWTGAVRGEVGELLSGSLAPYPE
jgi:hypothetical protein